MEINGYVLHNTRDKLQRVFALFKKEGKDIDDLELILAYYDREGGYITEGGVKVETGKFWDLERNKAKCEIEREKVRKLKEDTERLFEEKRKRNDRFWSKIKTIITILVPH